MSKERYNQIIDDIYKNYLIEDVKVLPNMSKEKMTEMGFRLSKKELINKCITDNKFSEKWGLKIEERELSLEERMQIWNERIKGLFIMLIWGHDKTQEESLNEHNIPNKLITLTYQDESIQFYE
jgi:hypothetical protein